MITAPLEQPLLVVAGAGSGKTATMAARVVWLVANDYVRPEQVLGLTFTRKAAGELGHRIRTYLGQLRRHIDPLPLAGSDRANGEPTVSTYHAFAARVCRTRVRADTADALLLTERPGGRSWTRWCVPTGDMTGWTSRPTR